MKLIWKLLAASALAASLGMTASAHAQTAALPNLGSSKAALAKESLKKDAVCTECHDETEKAPVLSLYQTRYGLRGDARTPSCQSCHGESLRHVKEGPQTGASGASRFRPAPDVNFKKGALAANEDGERSAQCLSCHKGSKRHNWDGDPHQINGISCNDCHKVHRGTDPVMNKKTQAEVCFTCHKEQRADSHKISTHPMANGKVTCSDCHNAHGSSGPKLMKKNTPNETCYQCHAEKRGPFLFEHQPVVEDCASCHSPHGSNITPLLKSRAPFLCAECHDGTHASGTPVGPNAAGTQGGLKTTAPSKNLVGRSCMNCHNQIHGSNSPAGGYFQR